MADAAADKSEESIDVLGVWEGIYNCGGPENPLTLKIAARDGDLLKGELRMSISGSSATAAYRIQGRYFPDRRSFIFVPAEWIERPAGWRAGGLKGTMHENGLTLAGDLMACAGGASSGAFSARRIDAETLAEGRSAVAANPFSPPSGGPFEGSWRGTLSCEPTPARAIQVQITINLLQNGEALLAQVSSKWPEATGTGELHHVLAGTADKEGRLELKQISSGVDYAFGITRQEYEIENFSGKLNGSSIVVDITGGTRWAYCRSLSAKRDGMPEQPAAAKWRELVGTWSGFDFRKGPGQLAELKPWEELWWEGARQVRIDIREHDGRLYGNYATAQPFKAAPLQQDRYAAAIRPLFVTEGDRLVWVSEPPVRAEGVFSSARDGLGSRTQVFLLSLDDAGNLDVERIANPTSGLRLSRPTDDVVARLDAGQGPPVPLPLPPAGTLAGSPSVDEQCRALGEWARPGIEAASAPELSRRWGGRLEAMLPLFADAAFEPVFGLPYALTSEEERAAVVPMVRRICPSRLGPKDAFGRDLESFFSDKRTFAQAVGKLIDRQEVAGWYKTTLAEITELPLAPAAWERLAEIKTEAESRGEEVPAGDRATLQRAINDKRVAVLLAPIDAADDPASALKLVRDAAAKAESEALSGLSSPQRAELRQTLERRRQELVNEIAEPVFSIGSQAPPALAGAEAIEELLASPALGSLPALTSAEREAIKARLIEQRDRRLKNAVGKDLLELRSYPQGLAGLEAGADWRVRFDRRYARFAGAPPVLGAQREFVSGRSRRLKEALPAFEQAVNALEGSDAVEQARMLKGSYLSWPGDAGLPESLSYELLSAALSAAPEAPAKQTGQAPAAVEEPLDKHKKTAGPAQSARDLASATNAGPIDFSAYNQPAIVDAFYSGDFSALTDDFGVLLYVSSFNDFFSSTVNFVDQSCSLLYRPAIKKRILARATRNALGGGSPEQQGMRAFEHLLGLLQDAQRGGPSAILDRAGEIDIRKQEGEKDAARLAQTLGCRHPAAERIYHNMAVFVMGGEPILSPEVARRRRIDSFKHDAHTRCLKQYKQEAFCTCALKGIGEVGVGEEDWPQIVKDFGSTATLGKKYPGLMEVFRSCT